MKKSIWILNHYAGSMYFNKGGRHYWFSDFLQRARYNPVVFCCNINHTNGVTRFFRTNKLWVEKNAKEIDVPFVFVKSRPYHDNGKERILNMTLFYQNVKRAAKQYAKIHGKPDIILASSVHPLTLVAGLQLAKFFEVKCICEVRDLWPEAIITYSNRLTKNSFLSRVMYAGEKWIYKRADALIFTQEGGPDYIRSHHWDTEHGGPIDMKKAFHINNGVDLNAFDANVKKYWIDDEDMDNPDTYKVVYAGAVRRINNLGIILDAAKLVKNPDVRFIIYGDGDELEALRERVKNERIKNVIFKGKINKQHIPSIDVRSDLNVVHWEMSPLLRVGESFNKAFEYFAAGKPVFYTIRPGYSIVEKYHCGKITDGFSPKEIAKGIDEMSRLSDSEKDNMKRNARHAAEEYDFKKLTEKLIEIVEWCG